MKLDAPLAEALSNLRGNRDFAVVLKALAVHREEEVQRCVDGEGALQLRASGAAKTLKMWLDFYDEAPKVFEKLRTGK